MDVQIDFSPAFALAIVRVPAGGAIKAEAGVMTSMSGDMQIETKAQGGLFGSLKRSVLGGESFFINTFTSAVGGELTVAPTLPGDIIHMPLSGATPLMVQSGSWLASEAGVDVDTKWSGAKGFFSGEGLFLLRCSGQGDMLVSSYGAIREMTLAAGQVYKIDTGHIVAFEEGLGWQVNKVGGWKSTILSGEGLVATFTGPGKLWMQTRSASALVGWLTNVLPFSKSGSGS